MNVKKRSGKTEPFNEQKIRACIDRCCVDLTGKPYTGVDADAVMFNARIKLFDGIKTSDIDNGLVKSARGMIEQEPNYRFVASGLLVNTIYKEVFGTGVDSDAFELQYRTAFIVNLKKLIKAGIVNKAMARFDLNKLSKELKINRDREFAYLGLQTVYDRYLHHIDGHKMETPQAFWMRVAMGLALNEGDNREKWVVKFYNQLSNFDYMCSTPTLFNSGGTFNQLSSCFLSTFEDSIVGIFDGLLQEALKNKYAGGLGMDLTNFRATNSYIRGTNGETQGAVYFWKLYGDMLTAVNQGGKRRGAGCGYLETWHADIEDFIQLRKNTGDDRKRTHDMNTAHWIPDLFLKCVRDGKPWFLFTPSEVPELHELYGKEFEKKYYEYAKKGINGELRIFKEIDAKELWKKMLRSLFETGHPWITFKDPCNIRNPQQHTGVIHSSNLCTEITLNTRATTYNKNSRTIKNYGETAVCNLGSINLGNHLKKTDTGYEIDYDKLKNTIETGSRMLDNVIDINFYPTEEAKRSNTAHRPVGMGSMGWHDMFYKLGIMFDSDQAVKLSGQLYEFISYHTIAASNKLAKERGSYTTYEGSAWSLGELPMDTYRALMSSRSERAIGTTRGDVDWDALRKSISRYGMRNSNTMAIAPTATISSIVGCSPSIEPYYSVLYVYSTLSGEFTMVNKHFVNDMKSLGLWSQELIDEIKRTDGDITQISTVRLPEEITAKYKTAFQQDQFKMIESAAARQRWIDQAQSLNLYNDQTSLKYMNDLYMHAWNHGLKTTYYLRNQAASKVEKSTVSQTAAAEPENITACSLNSPPGECESCQ
jgi:ribonucleoside-diphosphate reductase alpha chain